MESRRGSHLSRHVAAGVERERSEVSPGRVWAVAVEIRRMQRDVQDRRHPRMSGVRHSTDALQSEACTSAVAVVMGYNGLIQGQQSRLATGVDVRQQGDVVMFRACRCGVCTLL